MFVVAASVMATAERLHFKVVLLGEGCVGKTSIVLRYTENSFNQEHKQTLQAAHISKNVSVAGKRIQLNLWDTAGQERYHALGPIYYRESHGAIVVFDVTDKDSFIKAKNWVKELKRMITTPLCIAVVGNKIDLEKKRNVTSEEAQEYAESVGAKFFETSAKQNKGIQELFLNICKRMIEAHGSTSDSSGSRSKSTPASGSRLAVTVQDDTQEEKKGGCGC
jgi:Ras-related protein Rab-21